MLFSELLSFTRRQPRPQPTARSSNCPAPQVASSTRFQVIVPLFLLPVNMYQVLEGVVKVEQIPAPTELASQ